jgi:hypothetical protein
MHAERPYTTGLLLCVIRFTNGSLTVHGLADPISGMLDPKSKLCTFRGALTDGRLIFPSDNLLRHSCSTFRTYKTSLTED